MTRRRRRPSPMISHLSQPNVRSAFERAILSHRNPQTTNLQVRNCRIRHLKSTARLFMADPPVLLDIAFVVGGSVRQREFLRMRADPESRCNTAYRVVPCSALSRPGRAADAVTIATGDMHRRRAIRGWSRCLRQKEETPW